MLTLSNYWHQIKIIQSAIFAIKFQRSDISLTKRDHDFDSPGIDLFSTTMMGFSQLQYFCLVISPVVTGNFQLDFVSTRILVMNLLADSYDERPDKSDTNRHPPGDLLQPPHWLVDSFWQLRNHLIYIDCSFLYNTKYHVKNIIMREKLFVDISYLSSLRLLMIIGLIGYCSISDFLLDRRYSANFWDKICNSSTPLSRNPFPDQGSNNGSGICNCPAVTPFLSPVQCVNNHPVRWCFLVATSRINEEGVIYSEILNLTCS